MKKTVTLILHGHRKFSSKTLETITLLENNPDITLRKSITSGPGNAAEIAQNESFKSDVIVAVGGDGTCNEVINGLMLHPNPTIIFGVIPNGTGNDFVRNFAEFEPREFLESILNESTRTIDLGKITFENGSRYFLNVADIGFGAKVIETMNRQRKSGIGGKFSYNLAIIRSFFSYRKPLLEVVNDDFHFVGKSLMVVFSNGTTFGHGLQIYPEAELDSGKLGLAVIGKVSLFQYARNLGNLKNGRKIVHPEVKYHEFEKITVNTENKKVFVETDGEIAGRSSIIVEVIPKTLKILA